jgi:hypothetical protein
MARKQGKNTLAKADLSAIARRATADSRPSILSAVFYLQAYPLFHNSLNEQYSLYIISSTDL